MRVKVSLTGDICLPQPGSMTLHDGVCTPACPYPPLVPLPCFEAPVPMLWGPGFTLRQNKLSTTVFHKAQPIALDGHDCGVMIPHLTIPPLNSKLAVIFLFSSRRVMFVASRVKANGESIGCTERNSTPLPLPMLCCAFPVPLPTGFPAFNSLNTVSVGMDLGDVVAGFIAIAAEIVGSALSRCLRLEAGGLGELADRLLGASTFQEWALKSALGILAGCARIALTRDGKLKVEVGSAYAGAGASVTYRRDGRFVLNAEVDALGWEAGLSSKDGRAPEAYLRGPGPLPAPALDWGSPL